jgi:hypothetical protein
MFMEHGKRRISLEIRVLLLALSACLFVSFQPCQFLVLPSGGYKYMVTIVAMRKEDGTIATQFKRGQFAFVDVELKNILSYAYSAEPYLLVARATFGQSLEGLAAFSGSMLAGQQMDVMPAFRIPDDAPYGSYVVKVMVFSNWPSSGGIPIAAYVTTVFDVVP